MSRYRPCPALELGCPSCHDKPCGLYEGGWARRGLLALAKVGGMKWIKENRPRRGGRRQGR